MHSLMNLPNPKNEIKSLREFHDAIENHVRGLLALGWTTESYGALLVPMVLGKLPADTRKSLAREHSNLEWTIDELRTSIAREIRVLEAGLCMPSPPVEDHQRPPILTASFHTGATGHVKKLKCVFCKSEHLTTQCDVISDQSKWMEVVKKEKLCYNCLGHHKIAQYQSKGRCKNCKGRHHTSLCQGNGSQNSPGSNRQEKDSKLTSVNTTLLQKTSTLTTADSTLQPTKVCFLKTAVATVRAGNHQTQANILLDEGAQQSFISESLAKQLKLTAQGKECVAISAFGASEAFNQTLPIATIFLKTVNGGEIPISVLIIPRISQPIHNLPFHYVKELPYLKDIHLTHAVSDNQEFDISVCIGADFYWSIVQETVIRGPGPTAVKSKLGYLLSGPLHNYSHSLTSSVLHLSTSEPETQSPSENTWEVEFGQTEQPSLASSNFLQEYLHNSVTHQPNGTYIVKFPWKPNHPPLPTNKSICERRVRSLVHKLSKTPETLKIYNGIMEEQLRRGFIEKVPESELARPCHYIPHHAVHKESATTPVRIVYDCSCHEARHLASLNDCLETGPAFLNDLPTILLRFRSHKYGLTADIEKAFLHVQLDQQDRDFTRFLWLCNPDDPDLRLFLFGSARSPFMLYAALHCHLTQSGTDISTNILQNLYVDNILSGCSTEEGAITYYNEARATLCAANFNLRSWASNSNHLSIAARKDQVADGNERVNVLGLVWNTIDDTLSLTQKPLDMGHPTVTKRQVLQQSSKSFDPLGVAYPVTIRAKLLLQTLWQKKISWDEPLSSEYQHLWQTLLQDLQHLNTISTPRYYWKDGIITDNPVELHMFSDASTKAYGAVGYLRCGTCTSFVIAKARVAPLKPLTLPKLELMGATIAAQMFTVIKSSIGYVINSVYMWTDSQIVIHWLNSEKKLKQFISNRVMEIRNICPAKCWRYCPSADNPADLLTRGISLSTLQESVIWTHGPEWITHEEQWPVWSPTEILHVQLASAETEVLVPESDEQPAEEQTGVQTVIDIERYSTLTKLLYVTAYVLRFIECVKPHVSKATGPITVTELSKAQTLWIQSCQLSSFSKEIKNLNNKPTSNRRLPLVRQLRLFLDSNNLLRCGGGYIMHQLVSMQSSPTCFQPNTD